MEEILAQAEDALTDARVPRYVKQLIRELYFRLTQAPWADQPLTVQPPAPAYGQSASVLTNNFGIPRRPNLSTLPSIPIRSQNLLYDQPIQRHPDFGLSQGAIQQSINNLWKPQASQIHPSSARGYHQMVLPQSLKPTVSAAQTKESSPRVPMAQLTPEQASQDGVFSASMDAQQFMGNTTARDKRPARDVVFTLRIDAVGTGSTREVDVISISPSDHRVLLAGRIVNFAEIQQIKKLAELTGYDDMAALPFGEKISGQGWYSALNAAEDPCLKRVCRRLAAVAMTDISHLKTVFVARIVLGSKIRWQGVQNEKKIVYVFLNEGEDGVLSLPDNGVKIRAQKGTAVCLTNDVKGLEKTTGGVFPDGYKLVLLAIFE